MSQRSSTENWLNPLRLRRVVQWGLLALCLALGIQFGLFVRHFASFGQTPLYSRPPGVEGFLPIGALVSFKHWLVNGVIDTIHPAALVLFVTFLVLALLTKNAFCSWVCPVGTLEDGVWLLSRKIIGRTFKVWPWLDLSLRGLKYLLLGFFLKLIVIDMPAQALQGFLDSPYWAVADVRMLHFFTAPSALTLGIVVGLIGLSLIYRNFWCRYLCPYGALLGVLSLLSPLKIHRDRGHCISCRRCSAVCPGQIPVHRLETVRSVECNGCLTCVANCPAPGALGMHLTGWRQPLHGWIFALVVVGVFAGGIGLGMVTGHWESSLQYQDFQRLIPLAERFGH